MVPLVTFKNYTTMKTDRLGNMIGDGKWHVDYSVMDFGGKYP